MGTSCDVPSKDTFLNEPVDIYLPVSLSLSLSGLDACRIKQTMIVVVVG
jgi:hypothetical protein